MSGKGKIGSDRSDLGAGRSLLNFMNFASGNLKSALEKPANFKRNINHRRYLQKQLKNYSKRKNDAGSGRKAGGSYTARSKASSKGHERRIPLTTKNWSSEMPKPEAYMAELQVDKTPGLRERNFPLSFWQEPIDVGSPAKEYAGSFYPMEQFQTSAYTAKKEIYETSCCEPYLENWESCTRPELSPQSSHCESIPSTLSDDSILDEFLTGEELTRSIDIKDLYVPELCLTDRSTEGLHEDSCISTVMSPSQYMLSPSGQGFFNFQLDHDAQSDLPPIALAFINPGSSSAGQLCE